MNLTSPTLKLRKTTENDYAFLKLSLSIDTKAKVNDFDHFQTAC